MPIDPDKYENADTGGILPGTNDYVNFLINNNLQSRLEKSEDPDAGREKEGFYFSELKEGDQIQLQFAGSDKPVFLKVVHAFDYSQDQFRPAPDYKPNLQLEVMDTGEDGGSMELQYFTPDEDNRVSYTTVPGNGFELVFSYFISKDRIHQFQKEEFIRGCQLSGRQRNIGYETTFFYTAPVVDYKVYRQTGSGGYTPVEMEPVSLNLQEENEKGENREFEAFEQMFTGIYDKYYAEAYGSRDWAAFNKPRILEIAGNDLKVSCIRVNNTGEAAADLRITVSQMNQDGTYGLWQAVRTPLPTPSHEPRIEVTEMYDPGGKDGDKNWSVTVAHIYSGDPKVNGLIYYRYPNVFVDSGEEISRVAVVVKPDGIVRELQTGEPYKPENNKPAIKASEDALHLTYPDGREVTNTVDIDDKVLATVRKVSSGLLSSEQIDTIA